MQSFIDEQSVKKIWDQTCAQLQIQLSPALYNMWIVSNPLTALEYKEDSSCLATITSPTAFHATHLKKNLHLQIKQCLDKTTGRNCEINYIVGEVSFTPVSTKKHSSYGFTTVAKTISPDFKESNKQNIKTNSFNTPQSPRVEDLFSQHSLISASQDRTDALIRSVGLRKDYTFETFAVSTTNEMAHAAATAVSNKPGMTYNPLFLYGGVGVGKTHLMHAIGSNILRNDPNKKIIYCTGEEFTNEIVYHIQKKNTSQFKSKYRNVDVLLIDDVQFIAGKNAVQEEFFHTFNALTKKGKQIVLTSDKAPHEMIMMEERIRSRFEAGLMIDIQIPSFELRTAILLIKSKAIGISIPIDIAKTIASKVESARKIEGIIISIRSEVELKGKTIDENLVNSLLNNEVVRKKAVINVTPSEIIKTVANHYRLKQTALKGKRRVKALVNARHIAMYLLKIELNLSFAEIGRWFSGRDHTSVLHAVRKIEKELKINDLVKRDVSALRTTLIASSR